MSALLLLPAFSLTPSSYPAASNLHWLALFFVNLVRKDLLSMSESHAPTSVWVGRLTRLTPPFLLTHSIILHTVTYSLCLYSVVMRISKNHNSLGCEQPLGLDVNQSPDVRVSANARPHQLRWGDWECGGYLSCTCNTDGWP